jgi:hypothetical protein
VVGGGVLCVVAGGGVGGGVEWVVIGGGDECVVVGAGVGGGVECVVVGGGVECVVVAFDLEWWATWCLATALCTWVVVFLVVVVVGVVVAAAAAWVFCVGVEPEEPHAATRQARTRPAERKRTRFICITSTRTPERVIASRGFYPRRGCTSPN